MKITRKIIILLVMIIGILLLSMPKVNAATLPIENNKVAAGRLKLKEEYIIGYQQYKNYSNLHCAEKGQRLWSTRYEV